MAAESMTHEILRSYDIVLTTRGVIVGQYKRAQAFFKKTKGQRQEASPNRWPLLGLRLYDSGSKISKILFFI